jgi:hypothetical protein
MGDAKEEPEELSVLEIRKQIVELEAALAALPSDAKEEKLALEASIKELRHKIQNYIF